MKYFQASPSDLVGWLYRVSVADDADATMFELGPDGSVKATSTFEAFEAYCRELRPEVSALDALVAINAVPEENNTLMRRVMSRLRTTNRTCDMALLLAHHDRKSGGGDDENDQANARGGGDIVNAVRFELAVKKMTKAEAERFNINPEDRSSYFRLGSPSSKLNYIAADESEWFERITHIVSGQPVVSCIPWEPPDAFAGITTALANAILDDIDSGMPDGSRYSHSSNAQRRAAWKVVQQHTGKPEKECRRIISKWVKNSVLISKEYYSEAQRRNVGGLHLNPAKRPG